MTKRLRQFLAVLLIGFGAAAYADPPARVARLNLVAGPVSFASADAPDAWTQAVLNRPVTTGDRLWAADTARAELHVGSTAIRLGAFTNVDVLNLDDRMLQMRLAQGAVNLRVRDLPDGEIVEIATPGGAVLVRQPGSYRVSSDPQNDTTRVLVNFGQAEVVTPTQTVTVPSGQSAVLSPAGIAFEVAAYASADDFDRWSADRDRREDRVASTRYVSRDMTGYEDLDDHGVWRTLPEYGAVWVPARVAPGWAPYRHGHWAWVSPWGWTWIDDAPWGFAPFHYGRWVWAGSYWAWAPGAVSRRPVYAPALVAFVGGSRWSARHGPAVGWFPLGYREPYRPWYRASERHVRNVNVTHVTNVTQIHNTTNVRYVNRTNPRAVTVVPQQAFVSARPVSQATVQVAASELTQAPVTQAAPPARPARASFTHDRPGSRPPTQATAREVVAVNPLPRPAAQAGLAAPDAGRAARRPDDETPVRVISRDRAEARDSARSRSQPAPSTTVAPGAAQSVQSATPAPPASPAVTITTAAPTAAPAPAASAAPAAAAPAALAAPTGTRTAPSAATTAPIGPVATPPSSARSAPVPLAQPVVAPAQPVPVNAAAPPLATSPSAAPAPSAPQAASRPAQRFATEERTPSPRAAQPLVVAPATAAPAIAAPTPAVREAQPGRADPGGARADERAARIDARREERATARLEDRNARAAATPPAPALPARLEERRAARAEEAPRARPPAPQPGPDSTPSPQREARSPDRAPQPPRVSPISQPRAAEPPRAAPAPQPRAEAPRPTPAPQPRAAEAPRPAAAPQSAAVAPSAAPPAREQRRAPQP